MFRVIVLGGVALVGACGGNVITAGGKDASADAPGPDAALLDQGFPSELPAMIDAGPPLVDAGKADADGD